MKEINVIGTMQLLAACQKASSVQKLVVKSSTAGVRHRPRRRRACSPRTWSRRHLPSSGWAKDSVEVESYVRGLARRRPDLTVTTLRFANFLGPTANTPMAQYFSLPVVPKVWGYDARLQFCHEDDGLEVTRRATVEEHPGIYNVSGDGVSGAVPGDPPRRPGRDARVVALRRRRRATGSGAAGSPTSARSRSGFLTHGRVVDTARLRKGFGYTARYTTESAFADFVHARRLNSVLSPELVSGAETVAGRILTGWTA